MGMTTDTTEVTYKYKNERPYPLPLLVHLSLLGLCLCSLPEAILESTGHGL